MLLESHPPAYLTNWGAAYCGDSLDLLAALPDASVNLVLTSPPFALQREKDRKSTRLNSSHLKLSRMPSSA